MRDKILSWLIVLVVIFVTGHNVDHIVRDGVSLPFLIFVCVVYAMIGVPLYLYWKDKVGPRFFTIAALVGFALGWLGHFSPFTEQPPGYIFEAYKSPLAGWFALAPLFGLMLTLAALAVYCGYRWSCAVERSTT